MGRKVHPVGFRLKVIRDWNTRWFAEGRQYEERLHEDFDVRALIKRELPAAGVSRIEIERFPKQVQVTIHTAKPGIVIGRKGASVKELRNKLRQLTGGKVVKLEVEEVSQPDVNAQLIAENVAGQLQRRISHGRAMKRAVMQARRQGAEGIRIEVGGRLGGSEMARREKVSDGRVPRNTIRADLEYGFAEALTTFGQIGVKVWVYKGEILPQRPDTTDVYISE